MFNGLLVVEPSHQYN